MPSLLTLVAALVVGASLVLGARFWFNRIQKRKAKVRIGIEVLASRSWKEGLDLLARAVAADGGWDVEMLASAAGQPTAERILVQGGRRALLVYKHGTAYRIGAGVIAEGERRRQDLGASELWIATLGTVEPDARIQADRTGITLIDGPSLSARVANVLEPRVHAEVEREAEESVKRPRDIATFAVALLVLAVIGARLPGQFSAADVSEATAPAPISARPVAVAVESAPEPEMDPDTRAARRAALAAELVDVGGVTAAAWSSNTTVVVTLAATGDIDAVFAQACLLSAQYPELSESRLQFESEDPAVGVRWRRCA